MQTQADKLEEAKEWLNHKFRGKTIYKDHPLVVIDTLIDKALKEQEQEVKPSDREKALEDFKVWVGKAPHHELHEDYFLDGFECQYKILCKVLQQPKIKEVSEKVFDLLLQSKALTAKVFSIQFPNGFKVVKGK